MASLDLRRVHPGRFWSKVDKSQGEYGCWLWLGSVNGKGYGTYGWWMAHRLAYILTNGPEALPRDKQIDHLCQTRLCVNPRHHDVVTGRENTLRGNGAPVRTLRRTGKRIVEP